MKKIMAMAIVMVAMVCGANSATAQNYNKDGKTFTQVRAARASNDIETAYTWVDTKGNIYPIWLHQYAKGDKQGQWTAYVVKVSEKSGKEYKSYLKDGMEIAEQIRSEMAL